jgi:hypothetical protein
MSPPGLRWRKLFVLHLMVALGMQVFANLAPMFQPTAQFTFFNFP